MVFSTSFGIEDQVISHAIFSQKLGNIEALTLDTGRLFPETYATWDKTLLQYGCSIRSYSPNSEDLEHFVNTNGINTFYSIIGLQAGMLLYPEGSTAKKGSCTKAIKEGEDFRAGRWWEDSSKKECGLHR